MMQVSEVTWSQAEDEVAKAAFKQAYERETNALIQEVNEQTGMITELNQVWRLHDFLSARRHEIDGKYDYRYPVLIFVLARLVKEGWLSLHELDGLEPDKLTKVAALTRM